MARKPDDKQKIQAPSVAEIATGFDQVLGSFRRKVQYQESVLTRGALVNAMTIHFLSLKAEVQRRIIEAGVKKYEELLDSDDEVETWKFTPSEMAAIHASGTNDDDRPAVKKNEKSPKDRIAKVGRTPRKQGEDVEGKAVGGDRPESDGRGPLK